MQRLRFRSIQTMQRNFFDIAKKCTDLGDASLYLEGWDLLNVLEGRNGTTRPNCIRRHRCIRCGDCPFECRLLRRSSKGPPTVLHAKGVNVHFWLLHIHTYLVQQWPRPGSLNCIITGSVMKWFKRLYDNLTLPATKRYDDWWNNWVLTL
jgi:hypothetical protein